MTARARVKILNHKLAGSRHYLLTLEAPVSIRRARPGQFVQIRVSDTSEPLLRRPFSIHRVKGNAFEVLYEVVGRASEILSQSRAGECLDVIGPLGNGFPGPGPAARIILVGGGMGVAPLVFLAEKFAVKNKEVMVLLGARDKSGILCERDFSRLKNSVRIATDNGSRGFKGRVSGLLESVLESGTDSGELAIYACGPRPMLREVARLSRESNVTSWLSLEEHMACGLGVCLGCVVDTVDGYKRVCKEGPVFEASRLIWEKRRLKGED
ncbi:MAG: dihydroorotate dehydrogenase electron transfer subunit [Candidatus Omnitrophota bacterium]